MLVSVAEGWVLAEFAGLRGAARIVSGDECEQNPLPRKISMSSIRVIISCCHTGPNPAPGLGLARSLKAGYPDSFLVGKDHSTQASGLHTEFFDEVWVARPWGELHLVDHRAQIIARLEELDGYYLPGSDLEARWLAEESHPRILIPGIDIFRRTAKPFEKVAEILPVRVPAFIGLDAGDREVYNFAVDHGWKVWAKGPVMDAYRVFNWTGIQQARHSLAACWGQQSFFLQKHITGTEVMLAFAAYQGHLLGTAVVDKRLVTSEGKCWSGEITTASPELLNAVALLVRELHWTGGGELELVKDEAGILWLIDWNYRFPAWIHGATIGGINLPALLIAAASGVQPVPPRCASRQFTRVVLEIPVLSSIPLPAPPPAARSTNVPSKLSASNPSGLPALMQRLFGLEGRAATSQHSDRPARVDSAFAQAIREHVGPSLQTPARVFLPKIAEVGFRQAQAAAAMDLPVRLTPTYSVKTNPDRRLLVMARAHGLRAEVISTGEARWARELGFSLGETIYNGPVPLNPAELDGEELSAVFADSLESFHGLCDRGPGVAKTVGMRLNAFDTGSRFGLRLGSAYRFGIVANAIRDRLPRGVRFGVHSHLQSSVTGVAEWLAQARAFVEMASSLEFASGRPIQMLDLGGGWTSESFGPFLRDHLPGLVAHVHRRLPHVEDVVIEPGKAVCEQSHVLVSRILEIRRTDWIREIVADACLAEMPLAGYFPREVYLLTAGGNLHRLVDGFDRILGRVCMEHDILAGGLNIPPDAEVGDWLVFSHAGAYEASMRYTFGVGGFHE
jgi:diaminopimelate decarboxylase